jgi:hypothetical protein
MPLFPNLDSVKPQIHGVAIKEDSNIMPWHIPDKLLEPEIWKFYDPNLDAIKEDIGRVNNFARNLEIEEY